MRLSQFAGRKSHFRLDEAADRYILVAGGIGMTMADHLKHLGKDYEIHYCGRSRASMAFLDRLQRNHTDDLRIYVGEEGQRLDLGALVAHASDAEVYACGPERLLSALEEAMAERPWSLHIEHFSLATPRLDAGNERSFEIVLSDSKFDLVVSAEQTLLQALHAAGIDVTSDCEEGLCGSCEIAVIEGEIDHRDNVLTRAEGDRIMACCSRANGKIILAL